MQQRLDLGQARDRPEEMRGKQGMAAWGRMEPVPEQMGIHDLSRGDHRLSPHV